MDIQGVFDDIVESHNTLVGTIDERLDRLEKQQSDTEHSHAALERAVSVLERAVARDGAHATALWCDTISDDRAAAIIAERDRQDAKWGPQDHSLPEWLAILMEEVGELAAAILGHRFGNDDHPELDWKKEAIQVAAVALSMIEQYDETCGKCSDHPE